MKIILDQDLPIDPAEGMTAGRIVDVVELGPALIEGGRTLGNVIAYCIGDKGSKVGILGNEGHVIQWDRECQLCGAEFHAELRGPCRECGAAARHVESVVFAQPAAEGAQ